ncbi:MAG: DUF541 domain-containing protein [Proteobacteria bacterium]|nr:DUF541 domain-containing protein [Pseudomonadota bacterium]
MKKLLSPRRAILPAATCLFVFGGFVPPVQAQIPPPIAAERGQPPQQGGRPPMGMPRSITVSGEAHDDFQPDMAMLSVVLTSRDPQLAAAKKQNDQQVESLLNVVGKLRLPKEKLTTSNIYINPEYRYDKQNQQKLTGYVVSRNILNGMDFRLAQPERHAMGLRTRAFQQARERAAALAEASGSRLGPPLQIQVGNAQPPMPQPMMAMAARSMEADAASVAPTVPGAVALQETVTVTFALVDPNNDRR